MKIGIVGAGITGLGAGVILSREHEVHLFESDSRLGGHAHTVEIAEEGGRVPMDVGFLVFNELTYPHLTAFFRYLDVATEDSDMSLSVRSIEDGLEWSGSNLNTVFGQRRNLIRPRFYRMLSEILRFHREAESNLALSRRHGWTLGDLFKARNFGRELSERYILPIGAAIWSTPEFGMLDYPADTFLTFFLNHKLLQVNDRPVWKTVSGGSKSYVMKAERRITHVHRGTEVLEVASAGTQVRVRTAAGEDVFDRVIMATHAPVTRRLLKEPTARESEILGAFSTENNEAVLHRDPRAMPLTQRCWASWNVLAGAGSKVSLTYHLNRLQSLRTANPYFLTLNPLSTLDGRIQRFSFHHPLFTRDTIRAQQNLDEIQGIRGIFYAGAWTRYGFHEDGLLSAVRVSGKLGTQAPWEALWKVA